jgi:hypothetical protein
MAWLIKTDGTRTEVKGTGPGGRVELEQMYEAMDCELVEGIQLMKGDVKIDGVPHDHAYADEEGLIKGGPIVLNPTASFLVGHPIVGNVLFCRFGGEDNAESF